MKKISLTAPAIPTTQLILANCSIHVIRHNVEGSIVCVSDVEGLTGSNIIQIRF